MAVTITSNKKNTSLVLHVSAANTGNVVIAGNSTVSNVATSNEVLTGAYITQVFWGNDGNGHVQILRGSTLVAVLDSTGYKDYAGSGMPLSVGQEANLQVNFVGSSNGYVILEMQKVGNFTSDYFVG